MKHKAKKLEKYQLRTEKRWKVRLTGRVFRHSRNEAWKEEKPVKDSGEER